MLRGPKAPCQQVLILLVALAICLPIGAGDSPKTTENLMSSKQTTLLIEGSYHSTAATASQRQALSRALRAVLGRVVSDTASLHFAVYPVNGGKAVGVLVNGPGTGVKRVEEAARHGRLFVDLDHVLLIITTATRIANEAETGVTPSPILAREALAAEAVATKATDSRIRPVDSAQMLRARRRVSDAEESGDASGDYSSGEDGEEASGKPSQEPRDPHGVYFCLKTNEVTGFYRREHCQGPCRLPSERRHRCCPPNLKGGYCTSSDRLPSFRCETPTPACTLRTECEREDDSWPCRFSSCREGVCFLGVCRPAKAHKVRVASATRHLGRLWA